jgi:RNA polymerase sigma-70 factor, ECF subfamily
VQRTQPIVQTTSGDLIGLLRRVAAQDRDAFDGLYRTTSAKLYGVIVNIAGRKDIAEELLQDTYVKIWNRAAGFDPAKGSAITWMATIARHTALDAIRRVTPVSIEERPDVLEMASEEPGPAQLLERSENAGRLTRCLGLLDPEKRELVVLAYMEGYSREELAQKCSRPVATVKTWLHRSLAQLKDCLSQ